MCSSLLYYITDRTAFPGGESARRRALLDKIAEAVSSGVDYIQLREKDLSSRDLESLAREAVRILRGGSQPNAGQGTRGTVLLINSRADIALAVGADGVHLRSDDISPTEVKQIWAGCHDVRAGTLPSGASPGSAQTALSRGPLIGVSCHSPKKVADSKSAGADFAVFAPVFEKKDATGVRPAGLESLREACRVQIPVLALGGITLQNARSCLEAGAAGIAAIRLFQENDVTAVVKELRG